VLGLGGVPGDVVWVDGHGARRFDVEKLFMKMDMQSCKMDELLDLVEMVVDKYKK
jgi:hypothetical protein